MPLHFSNAVVVHVSEEETTRKRKVNDGEVVIFFLPPTAVIFGPLILGFAFLPPK